ncbi:PIN domain-containing protein [Opitutus sp. ER46]|uniref:PIN domain-containing protein n=1 Tax=Opitutus sp. ER46 TaxID=2161864 RepID=UPI000D314277|nr:PIN domain-containing protein [Opitutus sp. ER46]PTX96584.1 hypothetical protein DB354_07975 [Opitutus sp. ER46]
MPDIPTPKQIVFVDCENIPSFDLSRIAGQPLEVSLVLGKQQKQVGIEIFKAALRFPAQVKLIESGVTGHNALDLVLAAHLGQALARHADAEFVIVSKDRDFDPLIAHLQAQDVSARRDPDFLAVRKSAPPRPSRSPATPPRRPKAPKPAAAGPAATASETLHSPRFAELARFIQTESSPLPRKKTALLRLIANRFGNQLSPDEQQEVLHELARRKVIALTDGGTVTYPSATRS